MNVEETPKWLVTAEEAFPDMERLVLGATRTLDISLHVFSGRTKTRSTEAINKRIMNWAELLADAASRHVEIRFLLNDFDPVGGPDLHATVWERMQFLEEALAPLDPSARQRLKMLVAHPGGQSGALLRWPLWPVVRRMAKGKVQSFRATPRATPPGLRHLREDGSIRWWPPARNFTQTFHQKFLIADAKCAIIGGLDIDERRFDDPVHARQAAETWHDVSALFDGRAVSQLSDHFRQCWQQVIRQGVSHASVYTEHHPDSAIDFVLPDRAPKRLNDTLKVIGDRTKDEDGIHVAVTRSKRAKNPFRAGPRPMITELEREHIDLFAGAERYIYLESQFLRSTKLRDALVIAMGRNKNLHTIVLLPGAPDVVAYDGSKSPVQKYGEWLQMRALARLRDIFPDRFGAFSLTNHRDREEIEERDALYGKSMVYIHSKVAIADDHRAIVSSANLNARSMRWDVEAGIVIDNHDAVKRLRRRLWQVHLDNAAAMLDPAEDPAAAFAGWRQCAAARREHGRQTARCGVVPYPLEKVKRFAKRHIFIPEEMV